jgi:ABC-type Zn uptake system ZnuABC Zn-binding protein ZnuA
MIIIIEKEKTVRRNFLILLTMSTVVIMFLAACQPSISQTSSLPRVLAAESFLADITQNVAGDRLKVDTLLPLGVDPHSYQITPQDTARISKSQVFIINGIGYEWWLQKTLDNIGGQRLVVTASYGLTPQPDNSGEHPDGDPHMWLDPNQVVYYVESIRDGLSQADPTGKDIYARNADAYIAQLRDLDQWIKNEVNQISPEKRLLVTNHESLGYFAKEYNFKVVGAVIPSLTSDASPSAQQLADLIQIIRSSSAKAIFLEIGANPNLAQQVAAETGTEVVTDLYLETLSAPDGPASTYLNMIKYDVTQIVKALAK